jgi:transposase-like protein
MMNIQLTHLIDERKCYEVVRKMRWPDGTRCPNCGSGEIKKRGFHSRHAYRQRYTCQGCQQQFDDLTDTIFEGHHQSLRVWILCLYLMGLNLSNEQIGQELDLDPGDAQRMTSQLRAGIVAKKSPSSSVAK